MSFLLMYVLFVGCFSDVRGNKSIFGGSIVFYFWAEKYLSPMFPYRVKYTESESDIKKLQFLLQKHPQCQNTFEILEKSKKNEKV